MWKIETADGAPQVTQKICTKHCFCPNTGFYVENSSYRPMSLPQKNFAVWIYVVGCIQTQNFCVLVGTFGHLPAKLP